MGHLVARTVSTSLGSNDRSMEELTMTIGVLAPIVMALISGLLMR